LAVVRCLGREYGADVNIADHKLHDGLDQCGPERTLRCRTVPGC
jgi:hypothetical protein